MKVCNLRYIISVHVNVTNFLDEMTNFHVILTEECGDALLIAYLRFRSNGVRCEAIPTSLPLDLTISLNRILSPIISYAFIKEAVLVM